jgi:pimeloyl-ACP methyl ester carboxylesterase
MRQLLLRRATRELPVLYGRMTKRGIPDGTMRRWLEPFARREMKRDFRKYAGAAMKGRKDMLAATPALRTFDKPVLVVWAKEDFLMPIETGRRLAADFPDSRFVEIPDSHTLVPWDQPALFAAHVRKFVAEASPVRAEAESARPAQR